MLVILGQKNMLLLIFQLMNWLGDMMRLKVKVRLQGYLEEFL